MKYISLLLVFGFLASGCATTYQQQGFTGGFSETQLRQDIYRVTFKGNALTSAERAADFTLLRCAELATESGYAFFMIIDGSHSTKISSHTTPTTTNTTASVYGTGNYATGTATSTTSGGQTYYHEKPRSSNTILMIHDQDAVTGVAYEADFIIRSLRNKYNLN